MCKYIGKGKCTLIIMPSDYMTGVTISEDGSDGTTAMLTVQRTIGTNDDITVSWTVVDNNNNPASSDFVPPNGTVTIPHRESQAVLEITPFDDNNPETPELFTIMLNAVVEGTGRLGAENERIVSLTVRDSDDAYGRIEWGTDDQLQITAVGHLILLYHLNNIFF